MKSCVRKDNTSKLVVATVVKIVSTTYEYILVVPYVDNCGLVLE